MSSKDQPNVSEHLNALKTMTEQYSQIIQNFNTRLSSLENSVKNCEYLLSEQQTTHSQLIKRVESIENDLSKQFLSNHNNQSSKPLNLNKNDPERPQSPLIETIEETQYENNHNHNNNNNTNTNNNNNNNNNNKNEYELQEIQLDAEQDDDLLNIGLHSSASSSLHSTNYNNHTITNNNNHNNNNNTNNIHNNNSSPPPAQQRYRTLSNRFPSTSPQPLQPSNANNNNNNNNNNNITSLRATDIPSTLVYNNDTNDNNHNDQIEEMGGIQKENIPPTFADDDDDIDMDKNQQTALQLFGLQTLDNSNDINDNDNDNDNDKDKDKDNNNNNNDNNIDLEVLFSSFESRTSLASKCMKQNDFETALEHLADGFDELYKYISRIPSDKTEIVSVAYCNRSICYGKLNKYKEALIAINKCISIRPNWFKSYSTMGALYAFQKNDNEAIKAYKRSLELLNNNEITTKHKIQRRLQMIIDRGEKNKNINNKKRKNEYNDNLLNESPAKRIKYNIDERERKLASKLNMKTVSELQVFLEINQQKKTGRKDEIIERIIDGIINGAIPKCIKCSSLLKYNKNNGYYSCSGYYDVTKKKRVPCDFYSNNVQRKPWITTKETY